MCGIAGIKAKLENKDIVLSKMLDSMRLRGPDNQGKYFDDEIALGHCRLKVIDLTAGGNQPMANENNDAWIVYNGEVYNFRELRKQLEHLGHRFKSQADTEVILHSYEEWGTDCLDKLRGMFAFGIWDKNRKELFLARDRLGIKPLYYYFKNGVFIFASQVRSILSCGLMLKELNALGLADYLGCGGLKEPWTIAKDIYSLLPAHYAVLNEQGFKSENYWDPIKVSLLSKPYLKNKDIYERINALLKESIELHLVSDVPLGIFLSGGIDSSSILSFAAKMLPRLKCVTLVFKEKTHNEAHFAHLAAKRYNTDLQEVPVDQEYLLKSLEEAVSAMDEPTFDGINTYFVSQAAKEAGLTVALSGLGGDEVFAGYPSFRRIARLTWFSRFQDLSPRILKQALENFCKKIILPSTSKDKIIELMKNGFSTMQLYFWMRMLFTQEQENRLLRKKELSAKEEVSGLSNLDIINQVSYLEMSNYMRDILLRDTDFMSMAHSLEVRVPFLDHKLIELMFAIPGRFKLGCLNKPLLINSLNEPLPEAIVRRRKKGFVFPFEFWLRQNLKEEVAAALQEKDRLLDEFLNPGAALEIWRGFLKGRISWQRPWALYVLKKWVKIYLQ